MSVHVYTSSMWRQKQEDLNGETFLGYIMRTCPQNKKRKKKSVTCWNIFWEPIELNNKNTTWCSRGWKTHPPTRHEWKTLNITQLPLNTTPSHTQCYNPQTLIQNILRQWARTTETFTDYWWQFTIAQPPWRCLAACCRTRYSLSIKSNNLLLGVFQISWKSCPPHTYMCMHTCTCLRSLVQNWKTQKRLEYPSAS